MTAPDSTWRDRALRAEVELGKRPLNTKEWVAASHDTWQLYLKTQNERDAAISERDALAKRCASLENKLSNVHANHANCDAELETARDLLDRSVEETRAAKTDRARLRANLDVAVEALKGMTRGRSCAHGWGDPCSLCNAYAALAKIAEPGATT